jgi:hypothetical protein
VEKVLNVCTENTDITKVAVGTEISLATAGGLATAIRIDSETHWAKKLVAPDQPDELLMPKAEFGPDSVVCVEEQKVAAEMQA